MAKPLTTDLLSEFIASIIEAHGCADQLIHIYADPRWIAFRETLLEVRNLSLKIVVQGIKI